VDAAQALPFPLGVTPSAGGANVAVVSRHASRILVSLFDGALETARIALDHRLGDVHFGFVPGLVAGVHYGLRAEGPWDPEHGQRFDPEKLLLDPYATQITGPFHHLPDLMQRGTETSLLVPKAIAGHAAADAQALPPHRPQFIYEVPVKGFTMLHPDVPPETRGTVAALAEPVIIEHFKRLGVDTVELMPLAAWIDERHLPALGLANAWGYNPVSFLAPDPRLAPGGLAEIRATVDALHAAGIRVVLDVVLNHTGESDVHGTTLSLRGLDEALYYRHANGELINDTGCGNTLALDEPAVLQLAMDALRSWAMRTGIDGFRFDLATVMGRTAPGFSPHAPLLSAIEQDPLLSRLIMIAEPWDVGPGGYQLGNFPARWQEWNDRYRDEVRRFWRGDAHIAGSFATRIAGSSDLFGGRHRPPSTGINFLAAHDGFTLQDAVTFAAKNNAANGEDNRDGNAHEPSWPGGDAKALLATLFLSRGTPMLTAGDEFGRSQSGNNNAYAQDNATTWLDWVKADQRLIGYTAALWQLRQALSPFFSDDFLTDDTARWFGADGGPMDWQDGGAQVLGLVLAAGRKRLALLFNRGPSRPPALPARAGHRWTRLFCSAEGADVPATSVCVFAEERLSRTGVDDAEVEALAIAAGIEPEWWEVDGTHHRVSPDTQRALLAAMGLGFATEEDLTQALDKLARPKPLVIRAGREETLLPAASRRRMLVIEDEHGGRRSLEVAPGMPARARLEAGCYRLLEADAAPRSVIATPGTCDLPEDIATGRRVFGLASHLYSLRHHGSEGIGDFETLRRLASLSAEAGGRYAGLNPLHHLFPSDRSRASPYQPSDRHYIDPIYISAWAVDDVVALGGEAGLAADDRRTLDEARRAPAIDYAKVRAVKDRALRAAFARFLAEEWSQESARAAALATFRREQAWWLDDYALFRALRSREHERPWWQWPAGLAAREPGAIAEARQALEEEVLYAEYLQWIADAQWHAARKRIAPVQLFGDLPFMVGRDSADVWARQHAFDAGATIGTPPDAFSATGQDWGLPAYRWDVFAAENDAWIRERATRAAELYSGYRVDHLVGFYRTFVIPADGSKRHLVPAEEEEQLAQGERLMAAFAEPGARIIAEDLGTVPDFVRQSLLRLDIPGYKVLRWEREWNEDGQPFRDPLQWPVCSVATTGTHDTETLAEWWDGADPDERAAVNEIPWLADRRSLPEEGPLTDVVRDALLELMYASASEFLILPMQDLFGWRDRINTPATVGRDNWTWRLPWAADRLDQEGAAVERARVLHGWARRHRRGV
jgi:glycogen operon protein